MFVMSCLDDFRVTTGVEVPVFKFFGVGSPKAKAAAESRVQKMWLRSSTWNFRESRSTAANKV